jgi:hypothetical protein
LAILEKEVWVGLMGSNTRHFENLGYEIPRRKDKWGSFTIPKGTKILVKVEDLPKGSDVLITRICDVCGTENYNKKYSRVLNERKNGFDKCSKCVEGISYPEKFMISILNQLKIKYKHQKTFKWSENKKYDFFVERFNCIIETHGSQHYENSRNRRGRSLEEEQDNDKLKENLAKLNGVKNYIIIDCRKSELNYIKNSVMKSELSKLLNLNNINWIKCEKFAREAMIKLISNLWNNGIKSTYVIGKRLNISRCSVTRYLNQSSLIGLCNYTGKEQLNKSVVQLTVKNKFVKEWKSINNAMRELNINGNGNISSVCRGKRKTAGGYKWMFKEDYDKYISEQENYIF